MSTYNFVYGKKQYQIEENNNRVNFISYYLSKINKNNDELCILYKGKIINSNNIKKFEKIKTKKKIKNLFVFNIKFNHKSNTKEMKNIVCPKCNNLSTFEVNENIISLKKCIYNHDYHDLSINKFIKSQTNKEKVINCSICTNSQIFYNNKIFYCSCNRYICPLC